MFIVAGLIVNYCGCVLFIAEWKVHHRGENAVAFQNEKHKGKWLRIKDNSTNCDVSYHSICILLIT